MSRVLPSGAAGARTLYLGISGVCHPSESLYRLIHGRSPWDDGHAPYEGVRILEAALQPWPDVEVVLTSTRPWSKGLEKVLEQLGPSLAKRVAGYTFEDLTEKVKREVATRDGGTRLVGISADDYWRMNKSQVVGTHVAWRQPKAWVAIDDEDILWPQAVRRERLVLTDGCLALMDPAAQDRLHTVLVMNFGWPAEAVVPANTARLDAR